MSIPLSRDLIVDAAMAIIDKEGVDALSMRKLGARLKVEAMSLYHHVANKDALLDLVVERFVMKAATAPEARSGNWQDRLRGFTRHFYETLISSPRLLPLLTTHSPRSATAMAEFTGAIGALVETGFASVEAYCIINSLSLMAYGHALAMAEHPIQKRAMAEPTDQTVYADYLVKLFRDPQALTDRHRHMFEFALTTFLDGLSLLHQQTTHR